MTLRGSSVVPTTVALHLHPDLQLAFVDLWSTRPPPGVAVDACATGCLSDGWATTLDGMDELVLCTAGDDGTIECHVPVALCHFKDLDSEWDKPLFVAAELATMSLLLTRHERRVLSTGNPDGAFVQAAVEALEVAQRHSAQMQGGRDGALAEELRERPAWHTCRSKGRLLLCHFAHLAGEARVLSRVAHLDATGVGYTATPPLGLTPLAVFSRLTTFQLNSMLPCP